MRKEDYPFHFMPDPRQLRFSQTIQPGGQTNPCCGCDLIHKTESATPQPSLTPTELPAAQADSVYGIPNFDHIILIVLENEYLQNVIGNPRMPNS